ncbi:MAG: sulfotransferase [Nitrospirae bacterium]|nr:sulfotransferase [Nitrospirota bacterium]
MPNFLIIGAQRSGTTALYHFLKRHPQIFMPGIKEPKFFLFDDRMPDFNDTHDREAAVARYKTMFSRSVTNFADYAALFQQVKNEKAVGEASPHYLYSPEAPLRISKLIPEVKLIAVLRDPVDRAYSNYFLDIAEFGGEMLISDFVLAINEENIDTEDIWSGSRHYARKGFYYTQLMRYLKIFSRERVKVYLYEELKDDPVAVVKDIFKFLDVDDTFVPDNIFNKYTEAINNSESSPRCLIKSILKYFPPNRLTRSFDSKDNKPVRQPIPPEVRKYLVQIYRKDILGLQDLIQRDLSKWLAV